MRIVNNLDFTFFSDLDKRWDTEAEYLAFYPNVQLGGHKDHVFALILEPKSEVETHEYINLYFADPDMAEEEWASMRNDLSEFWQEVFKEDISIVEAMQDGRKADGFDGGHFSPVMDEATHHFHSWIANNFT